MVMTLRAALTEGIKLLGDTTDATVLLCHAAELDRLQLAVRSGEQIDMGVYQKYLGYIERRKSREPVAYITGSKEFMGIDFAVRPGVLIPRPDTEHTVEYIINLYRDTCAGILDLCTGSGAIAVSLAYYMPDARVVAADISDVALQVAESNAAGNGVADRVRVVRADALSEYSFGTAFDVVVSNPPYIPDSVVPQLDADVAEYEPHLALCGGEDGLVFYRAIAKNALDVLNRGGRLVFEVGHDQAESVRDILADNYRDIEFVQDYAGINRVVAATKKE